jgi:2,3-bisphosphoglycerate-dependent phosphoglycerate mutase
MNGNERQSVEVVLIRHAQSVWNRENRFTGWADPDLTELGIAEAWAAARLMQCHGLRFDRAYSSRLKRARQTLDLILAVSGQEDLPREQDYRLNERHYGALQGVDKAQMTAEVGEDQVWRWRRGYADMPPVLAEDDPRHPLHARAWADVPREALHGAENLAMTRERVMGFWRERMEPHIQAGERVIVSAHGNTLRALLMGLADMTVAEVESFEIPTATPIVYRFDRNGEALDWRYLEGAGDCTRVA